MCLVNVEKPTRKNTTGYVVVCKDGNYFDSLYYTRRRFVKNKWYKAQSLRKGATFSLYGDAGFYGFFTRKDARVFKRHKRATSPHDNLKIVKCQFKDLIAEGTPATFGCYWEDNLRCFRARHRKILKIVS